MTPPHTIYPRGVSRLSVSTSTYNRLLMMKSVTRQRLAWNLRRLVHNHQTITTQTALAEKSGLGIPTINGLWHGARGLKRIEDLDRIASALEVDLTELFVAPPRDRAGQSTTPGVLALDSPPHEQNATPPPSFVDALRLIIKHHPDTAADVIAALIGQDARVVAEQSSLGIQRAVPVRKRNGRRGKKR
jgi:transcriptional regulator with XRE-family HTH domain